MQAESQPPPSDALLDRLTKAEVQLGFVDELVDSLNRTVFRQQQQIDRLAQAVAALDRRLRALAPGAQDAAEQPPAPE